jgi:predicted transcriptional regulator
MKSIALLTFVLFGFSSFSQSYLEELENSYERSKGASGAKIIYKIHLNSGTIRTYYASDFDNGKLIKMNEKAIHFELTKKEGEERRSVIINLEMTKITEFEIKYPKGECQYHFDFYY